MTDIYEALASTDGMKTSDEVPVRDDLSEIKGIGAGTAEKLYTAKIYTIRQLASTSPEKLAEAPGIGIATANKFIAEAKKHLEGFQKQVELSVLDMSDSSPVSLPDADEYVEIEEVEDSLMLEKISDIEFAEPEVDLKIRSSKLDQYCSIYKKVNILCAFREHRRSLIIKEIMTRNRKIRR